MRKIYIIASLLLVSFLIVSGCGGGGTGGTGGEDTGILINVSFFVESPNLDAAIHCCAVDDEGICTEVEEGLFDNFATMSITAELVNPSFDTFPARVTQCRITYLRTNEDPASPIIQSWDRYPNCLFVDGITECEVDLIDIDKKVVWWSDITSGLFVPAGRPTNYVAFYQCEYENKWGESEDFEGRISFRLDDYDVC